MSDNRYSTPSKPATRKLCPNQCGAVGILAKNGNSVDCPNCGLVR